MPDFDRTASIMSPAKLAQAKPEAPVSPAAWLDHMAADAGHQHIERLAELRSWLATAAAGRDDQPLAQALAQLAQALPGIDFSLLQSRGWWARTTGKSRSAGAQFASQYEQADEAAVTLARQLQALQNKQQGESGATERQLVEVAVETGALEKIIDQGARWLQDMRAQLKTRQAESPDAAQQQVIRQDAARCEVLVARIKQLRAASNAAKEVRDQAQSAAARRAALLQSLQQALGGPVKSWRARLSVLASAAGDDQSPALSLEGPTEAQRELDQCARRLAAECDQLGEQERALATHLAALSEQLAAAR